MKKVKSVGQDTPLDVLKTRNPLAISDISLIFAACFNLMVKLWVNQNHIKFQRQRQVW
jgi:hypothetical protein